MVLVGQAGLGAPVSFLGLIVSMEKGVLYVVATPIGNLGDISARAIEVLGSVGMIAAEDTRHSRPLLKSVGVDVPLVALHDHNERQVLEQITRKLSAGESVALISDAGTPLISDPGFPLVRECRRLGIRVSPVPGPSAAIAALSVAGLPSDRFLFVGFPARTSAARVEQFSSLKGESCTLVFYESSHRVQASLKEMGAVFGGDRPAVIARELTKLHETVLAGDLEWLNGQLESDPNQSKGEFVILVAGEVREPGRIDAESERVMRLLLPELPVKKAAALTARITGAKKNLLYQQALEWSKE